MDDRGAPGPRGRGLSNRSRSYLAALIALLATVTVLLLDNGDVGLRFRGWLGIDDRQVAAVQTQGGGSFRFFQVQDDGEPVGWNPCRPIKYEVNPDGAPEDATELLDEAIAEVSDAAGLRMEQVGTTDARNFDDRFSTTGSIEPVLIGWADADEVSELAGDVAGVAGPVTATRGPESRYVTGMAVFDSEAFAEISKYADGETQMRAIMMHELGHLLGLDHVDDPAELMNADNIGRDEFGEGDLTGLAKLGSISCG